MPDTFMASSRREGRWRPSPRRQLLVGTTVLLTAALLAFYITRKLSEEPATPDANLSGIVERPGTASRPAAANPAEPPTDPEGYGLPDASSPLPESIPSLVEEASRIVANLTAKFPDNPDALQMHAGLSKRIEYDDLSAGREDVAAVYTDAGRIYFTNGQPRVAEMIWGRAARLDPSNVECRQSIAWLYRSSNRLRDGIKPLEELADIEPDNPSYLLEIGRIHLQLNETEAAQRVFRSLRDKLPNHFAGYVALAQLYLQTNRNLPEAITLADKAVQLTPTASHYELLAAAREVNGEIAGAMEAVKRAMELSTDIEPYRKRVDLLAKKLASSEAARLLRKPDAPLPASQKEVWEELNGVSEFLDRAFPDDRDAIACKARYLFWSGKNADAKVCWERCLDLFPRYGGAYFGLGEAAFSQANYKEAAALFRKSLALGDREFAVQIRLARALINDDRAPEAVEVLERPVGAGSLPAEGLHVLADAYSQLGKMSQAKESYQGAIQAEPLRTEAHYRLAIVCTRLGQSEQARQAMARFRELSASSSASRKSGSVNYDDLVAMQVDGATFYFRAGNVCNARGITAEAETLWLRAAALDDRHVACRRELATLYHNLGNNEQAVRWLKELCRSQPDQIIWPLQLGELHVSLSQFEAAEKVFRTVCEKMPERFEGHASLAQLYLRADRNPARTLELLKTAVELDPRPEGYALLGEALEKQGNLAEATSAWKRAVELDPSNPQYRQIYESLRNE